MGTGGRVEVIGHDERHNLHFESFADGQAAEKCRRVIRRHEFAHRSADIERRQHDVRGDIREACRHFARIERVAQSYIPLRLPRRSEEHTSELQSLMRISYAVFCLKKKNYLQQKITKDVDQRRQIKTQSYI